MINNDYNPRLLITKNIDCCFLQLHLSAEKLSSEHHLRTVQKMTLRCGMKAVPRSWQAQICSNFTARHFKLTKMESLPTNPGCPAPSVVSMSPPRDAC